LIPWPPFRVKSHRHESQNCELEQGAAHRPDCPSRGLRRRARGRSAGLVFNRGRNTFFNKWLTLRSSHGISSAVFEKEHLVDLSQFMIMKKLTVLAALVAAVMISGVATASTASETRTAAVKAVNKAPAAEVPAKAAQVVTQVSKADQSSVAVAVVKAVAEKYPKALVATVASIAKAAPKAASAAATAAALASPEQAEAIAKAAAQAAPAEADSIAVEMAKAIPGSSEGIYAAVVKAVPQAQAKLEARRISVSNSATSAAAAGNVVSKHGTINGATVSAPTANSSATPGYDPNRYSSP